MPLITLTDKTYRQKLITVGILSLSLILVLVISNFPQFIEKYYSEGIFIAITRILHFIFNLFPFSVGDLLYIAVIGYLVYALIAVIRMLIKKLFRVLGIFVLNMLIYIQAIILIFYLFWGLNYYRPTAAQLLSLRDTTYTMQELAQVTHLLIDSTNAARAAIKGNEFNEDNKFIFRNSISAIRNLSATNAVLDINGPKIKSSLISPLLNYMGTSGYYNPFTAEAQLNYAMPIFDRPFTACHEISHQMGFGREDEADFIGFLAGIHSGDKLLRYSAYYAAMEEFMHHLRRRDSVSHKQLKLLLSPAVKQDLKTDMTYWMRYAGKIGLVSSTFYDQFLKANNQPAGLQTYNRMIILTMAYYKQSKIASEKQ